MLDNQLWQLIQNLSDGKFHSGEDLGQQLGLSRSAIWKMMSALATFGIDIYRVKRKGYRIAQKMILLDQQQIEDQLTPSIRQQIQLEILPTVHSTNQYLLEKQAEKKSGTIVLAEHQTSGRGRRARSWFSPFGANIYLSLLWKFDKDPSELRALSLATGVAVINALEKAGIYGLQLKWPNDILFDGKKIAGILIEMTGETHATTEVVIGIGVNVTMPATTGIDQAWTDIASLLGNHTPNRNQLTAYLIGEVIEMLHRFQQKGFSAFAKHWQALDAYYNRPVHVNTPQAIFQGIAKGINEQGHLILLDECHQERRFLHGEVSLRII